MEQKKVFEKVGILITMVAMMLGLAFVMSPSLANAEAEVIEIWNIRDLYNVRDDLSANYKLMTDIDMSETGDPNSPFNYYGNGWDPIGSDYVYGHNSAFTGVFDGNGHSIIGMTINIRESKLPANVGYDLSAGLFANNAGVIKNLKVARSTIYAERTGKKENDNVTKATVSAAPIAVYNSGRIIACGSETVCEAVGKGTYSIYYPSSGGSITYSSGNGTAAGICVENTGIIDSCYNSSTVDATSGYGTSGAYGICGGPYNVGKVSNCYNTGDIGKKYTGTNGYMIGVGSIKQSYYYTLKNGAFVSGRFFDAEGKSHDINESQLRNKKYLSGFDFDNVWTIETATDYKYPQLRNNMMDSEKHVDILEWKSIPTKTNYYTDEEIDPSGGVFTAYYVDDTHEDIIVTKDMLSEYDMEQVGEQEVTVKFREGTLKYSIQTSVRPEVSSMTLESMPTNTEFVRNTAFNFEGASARIEYTNGSSDIIPIRTEDTKGGDITKSGTYTITFERFGKTVEFEVKVIPVKPTSISIISPPNKTSYIEGQQINTDGLVVELKYNNGKSEAITDYTIEEYETTVGSRDIVIAYDGLHASFPVEFVQKSLSSILITSQPVKTNYIVSEAFDRTGMVVNAIYDNGFSETITEYAVSPISDNVGLQTLTVSYCGKSTTLNVNVAAKELHSIFVSEMPIKTSYIEGETFNPEGMVIMANYNDSLMEEITDYKLTGTSLNSVGEKTITVIYEGLTTTFNINVVAKTLTRITITSPTKQDYIEGENFDSTGMVVNALYNNGKTETVTGYTVDGFGENVDNEECLVTITYENKKASFIVKIHDPEENMTITEEPTCSTSGTKVLYCKDCNTILKTEMIDALGHSMTKHDAIVAKCEEAGSSEYWSCDRCEKFFSDENGKTEINENSWIIAASGHKWDEGKVTTNPTCDTDGIKTFTCTAEGCNETRTETVGKTGHEYSKVWVTDGDYHWHRCTHDNCTSKDSYGEHDWVENVTKYPTCTQTGIKIYTCSICEKTKREEIPKEEHKWDDSFTIDKPATCTEDGSKSIHCTDCNATKEETMIPKTGHSWGSVTYTWVSGNSTVIAERRCTNDPSHVEKETVKTTSNVTKAATYTAMGQTTYRAVFSNNAFETQTKVLANVPVLPKKAQPMAVKASVKTAKVKKLKKKAFVVAPIRVTNAKGSVKYKIAGGNAKSKKALKINVKTGKVTVRKKTKKGTYKLKVKVTAAGNTEYRAGSKTVGIAVIVK